MGTLVCVISSIKVVHTQSILLRQYYWYQWFHKGFLHQYHPYTINNFVQYRKIDNKIDRVWGPLFCLPSFVNLRNEKKTTQFLTNMGQNFKQNWCQWPYFSSSSEIQSFDFREQFSMVCFKIETSWPVSTHLACMWVT